MSDILGSTVVIEHDTTDEIIKKVYELWNQKLLSVKELFKDRSFEQFEREVYLAAIDQLWMEHIERMANLREDVAFEGYNQKQPLLVYQEKAYTLFITMIDEINHRVVRGLLSSGANTQVKQVEIDIDSLAPSNSPTAPEDHPLMRRSKKEGADEGIKVIRIK